MASSVQSFHDPSGAERAVAGDGRGEGGVSFVPREELDVIEPRVTKMRSCSWTWIMPVLLGVVGEVKWISETVIVLLSMKERLVTCVSKSLLTIFVEAC